MCVGSIWHGGTETFCLLSPNFIKILNYVKSLCIIFVLNWFKYFDQKNQTIFYPKMFQYSQTKICSRGQLPQISWMYGKYFLKYCNDLVDCLSKGNFFSSLYKLILNVLVLLLIFKFLVKLLVNSSNFLNFYSIFPWWYAILMDLLFSFLSCFSYWVAHPTASWRFIILLSACISSASSNLSSTSDCSRFFFISSIFFSRLLFMRNTLSL